MDLITLQCVFSGSRSIPGSADRCFQGHWLLGNKSAEIPNLNGALHSITGRSNCNRKAIITHSSSGSERLFPQWFLARQLMMASYNLVILILHKFFFLRFLRKKARYKCWVINGNKWEIARSEQHKTSDRKQKQNTEVLWERHKGKHLWLTV